MPVLVDFSQIAISSLMAQMGGHHQLEVDENILRHIILNVLRANRKKFSSEYGELILCIDDRNFWRRTAFPYYKAARRKNREESELDWNSIFTSLSKIKEELRQFFPYKVIQIDTAEADDIIGTIIHKYGTPLASLSRDNFLILSGDKDFIQLHQYGNVEQYDPTRKRWIKHSNPTDYLLEHIIRGDKGDGVPNILSDDNSFVLGSRQRPITKKRMDQYRNSITYDENAVLINNMSSREERNFRRNETLIDLGKVPNGIKEQVLKQFNEPNTKDRSQLLNFFIKNRMKLMIESLNDF